MVYHVFVYSIQIDPLLDPEGQTWTNFGPWRPNPNPTPQINLPRRNLQLFWNPFVLFESCIPYPNWPKLGPRGPNLTQFWTPRTQPKQNQNPKNKLTEKKSAAFLKPICLVWIISMACSKASSSDILVRSIEILWNSKPVLSCGLELPGKM